MAARSFSRTPPWDWTPPTHLGEQHEDDVSAVGVQRCHHVLVEGDHLIGRGVGGEEGGDEGAEAPLLQDGRQDAPALGRRSLDEHLRARTRTHAHRHTHTHRFLND